MHDAIVIVTAFLDVYLVDAVFSSIMHKKNSNTIRAVCYIGMAASVIAMYYLIPQPILRLPLCCVMVFLLSFPCFETEWLSRIMACAFFYCLYQIGEYFAHGIVSMINQFYLLGDSAFWVGVFSSYAYFFVFCLLYKRLPLRLYDPAERKSRLLILSSSVSCAVVMVFIVSFILKSNNIESLPFPFYLVCSFFFAAINMIMMGLSRRISALQDEKNMRLILEVQASQFDRYNEGVDRAYNEMRMLYHDMKHHMNAIYSMVGNEEKASVGEYIKEVTKILPVEVRYARTGNTAVDVVLQTYMAIAEKHGFYMDFDLDVHSLLIGNDALSVILGNALDNAVEACEKLKETENPHIGIAIRQKGEYLFICITNPIEWALKFDKELPLSTKPDSEFHGHGLKNIDKMVNRYDGKLHCSVENGSFKFQCMLRNIRLADLNDEETAKKTIKTA